MLGPLELSSGVSGNGKLSTGAQNRLPQLSINLKTPQCAPCRWRFYLKLPLDALPPKLAKRPANPKDTSFAEPAALQGAPAGKQSCAQSCEGGSQSEQRCMSVPAAPAAIAPMAAAPVAAAPLLLRSLQRLSSTCTAGEARSSWGRRTSEPRCRPTACGSFCGLKYGA